LNKTVRTLETECGAGKHYNYFRDYDPGIGRYFQSDPVGLRGGPSTYLYVGAMPLASTDPFGLQSIHPGNPNLVTPICDGRGNIVVQLPYHRLSPMQEKCISNCLLVHEFNHIDDFFSSGRGGICKGQPHGVRPGIGNAGGSEDKAYGAELQCLSATLGGLPSCHDCRPVIEKRINDINTNRGR
jgi:RHS repeat-associated protein